MKKILFLGFMCLILNKMQSQNVISEHFPVFENCNEMDGKVLEKCFYSQLQNHVFNNFKVPENLTKQQYKGTIFVLFEVDVAGNFKVQNVDAIYAELIDESKRVFALLPKITAATFNGKPTYARYSLQIAIPLQNPLIVNQGLTQNSKPNFVANRNNKLTELDSILYKKYDDEVYKSSLNVAFSHNNYARFDERLNQMGSNNHTGSKPFSYQEVNKYFDFKAENFKLKSKSTGWWGRKFFDENMVTIKGNGYWFTVNPMADLQLGKSSSNVKSNSTYQNTRAIQIQGGLGEQLTFSTTIFESQGNFANYYNNYSQSIKAGGGVPAVIPGIGIAKEFNTTQFDFPSAEANLTYVPNKFINLQAGYGRNFIGDGYRSLLLGDGASPYPFFKINTTFWKIKYTNTYMWLRDVRPEATVERTYTTKYMANHYLSWNVNNRLNIGFFESVIWSDTNGRGFDFNFVNPLIFYRTVEFTSSARTGNAVLGLTSKYKLNNQINFYGQFLLDEFSLSDVKAQQQSWKNKFGYQLGAKYYNAFNIKDLTLQLEYNRVRPYVYSHSDPLTNYGHTNQSMGHNWGGNFQEFIAIARYRNQRYYADLKFTYGVKGFDFDTADNKFNYGGNIYKNYNNDRPFDNGVQVGQGNKTNIIIADLQTGYLVNPATNLKIFSNVLYRSFTPNTDTANTFKENTTWFSLGFRTDVFNFYFDY